MGMPDRGELSGPDSERNRFSLSGPFVPPEVRLFGTQEPAPVLQGARYLGRPLSYRDRAEFERVMTANGEHLGPTGQAIDIEQLSDDDAFAEWVEKLDVLRALDQRFLGDEIVALTSLSCINRGHCQNAMAAGWAAEAHVGEGTGNECLEATPRFAFGDLDLNRVEALVLLDNEQNHRLLRSLGFQEEGVAERSLRVNGEWRDHRRFSYDAARWADRPKQLVDA